MLITLTDGSRSANSNISEVGLSTKPARSLEKFTEYSCDQRPRRGPYADAELFKFRPVGDSSDPVFRYQFARQV